MKKTNFTIAAFATFCAINAHAAPVPVPVGFEHIEYKQAGNTYTWQPIDKYSPTKGGVVFRGDTTISDAKPKIVTQQKLPFDNRPSATAPKATIESPFTKRNFGKALTLAGKAVWPIGVALAVGDIYNYLSQLDITNVKNTPDGITAEKLVNVMGKDWTTNPANPSTWRSAPCAYIEEVFKAAGANVTFTFNGSLADPLCIRSDGQVYRTYYRDTTGATTRPITEQEIIDSIENDQTWDEKRAKALAEAIKYGIQIQTDTPTVTGPTSIPGQTTTSTTPTQVANGTNTPVAPGTPGAQPATQTTTSTTTNNVTYNNNNATYNTTTKVETSIVNNVTNTTTKTTDKVETKENDVPAEKEPEPDFCQKNPQSLACEKGDVTDSALPPLPTLYERKYPDGLTGIWNSKSADLKSTSLFTTASKLMPTGISGGVCPKWDVNLSFGPSIGDYGLKDVSPPCAMWDIAKIIVLVSALIAARGLVFGG